MFKTAVIIPARWASTRFPGKPLHLLAGKPLVQHVWERACRARAVQLVIIATDDMRIAEAAFAFGAEVALTSPRCVSGTDRCAEVARRLEKEGFTHVINVQGDEPLISPALITQLVRALGKDPGLQMVTAATPFAQNEDPSNPNCVKVVLSKDSSALYFSRSLLPFPATERRSPSSGIWGFTDTRLPSSAALSNGKPALWRPQNPSNNSAPWSTVSGSKYSAPSIPQSA